MFFASFRSFPTESSLDIELDIDMALDPASDDIEVLRKQHRNVTLLFEMYATENHRLRQLVHAWQRRLEIGRQARETSLEIAVVAGEIAAGAASPETVARLVADGACDSYVITDAAVSLGTLRRFYAAKDTWDGIAPRLVVPG